MRSAAYFEDLYQRAKHEPVSKADLAAVAAELQTSRTETDRYKLIQTLGRAGASHYRELVSGFLNSPGDPMLARAAIEALCQDWHLTERYLSDLKAFIVGVEWDTDEEARQMALICAGPYLHANDDKELVALLLRIVRNPEERRLIREDAYRALAVGAGWDVSELPSYGSRFDPARHASAEVLNEAETEVSS